MILLHERNIKDQIEELTDEWKLKLIHCYYKADTIDMPIDAIAQHIIDSPEDYKGVVEFKPKSMDSNDYYQTYCEPMELSF